MKTLLIKILGWLSGASKTVFIFVLPILEDEMAQLLAALLPIAMDVVSSLADSPKTGAEKRAAVAPRSRHYSAERSAIYAPAARCICRPMTSRITSLVPGA